MPEVGVRELKNQATEILREVREQHVEYIVTYRGKPVAVLAPIVEGLPLPSTKRTVPSQAELEARWAEWDELAREIDEEWQSELGAVELLSKDRDT
jgi:prevent-host-death family protein